MPGLVTVSEQLPEPLVSVPVQLPPVELLTVTLPVGRGFPVLGALAPTEKLAVMVCPATALVCGLLTVVVVVAWLTGSVAVPVLAKNVVLPAYLAVSVWVPTLVTVRMQLPLPEARVPEQVSPAVSVTETVPDGVPEPPLAATEKFAVTCWPTTADPTAVIVVVVPDGLTCSAVVPELPL